MISQGIGQILGQARDIAMLPARLARQKRGVGQTPADVVFAENKWRLIRYRARPEGVAHRTPVLLVPSLINRHYILDLLPDKSLAADLVARGHDVFIVDWGRPEAEDRFLSFGDYTEGYLSRAVSRVARLAGRSQVHLFGYCLGGTMTAIWSALHPEGAASLCTLGAPVSFRDEGLLAAFCGSPGFDVASVISGFGNLPWPLMQLAFHALRPTLSLSKLVQLIHRAGDERYLEGFLALETWGNDNVSFPGRCFQEYVEELYRKDALVEGNLVISGRSVDLGAIRCPTLAVTFEHDNIVPWKSAAELLKRVGGPTEHLHLPGGHVGSVVSSAAKKNLWPKISEFFGRSEPVEARRTNHQKTREAKRALA